MLSGFAISLIAVVLGIGLFIYMTIKNYSIIYGSAVAAAITLITIDSDHPP
mgnify:CR=1 FL=1